MEVNLIRKLKLRAAIAQSNWRGWRELQPFTNDWESAILPVSRQEAARKIMEASRRLGQRGWGFEAKQHSASVNWQNISELRSVRWFRKNLAGKAVQKITEV